jgi:dTDP-4-amino-4,6-dideoxygalactose transaminase
MADNAKIPFLDLVTPHAELKDELCDVFQRALRTAGFISGPMVQGFEEDFARYCDTQHCIGVGSGTDALRFALTAAGIEEGDVVVTVPHTFIATTEAISQCGAHPAFVDIDEATYNMDPRKLQEYLERDCEFDQNLEMLVERRTGRRVRAVVPVHLYGQMADMDAILGLAREHGLLVIEDACQAHGAEYFSKVENRWLKAGSVGVAAAFSFYPGKNLGACGEAGAVTTNDATIAQKIRVLRDHGQAAKYYHDVEGYNGRLDSIQAGILGVKLKHLPKWTELRRQAARCYRELFSVANGASPRLPYEPSWTRAVYHLFVIRVSNRDNLQTRLNEANIGTGIHYPIPLHLQRAYSSMGYSAGAFPVCEKVASEILSLPMYPGLEPAQQQKVVDWVLDFAGCPQSLKAKRASGAQ